MRFSIVMPTYNRSSTVGAAVRSVCVQQEASNEVEIVLVDDSTDDTLEVATQVLRSFPACTLVKYRGPTRLGCTGARNRGIDLPSGEGLIFLDSAPELLPRPLLHIRDFF